MIRCMTMGVCAALLMAVAVGAQDTAAPGSKTLTFEGDKALADVATTGGVALDAGKGRNDSSALRVGPGGKAVWRFAEKGASGTIEMWVFEDGTQRSNEKGYGSGPLWGVMYADGAPALLTGAVYASYLAGNSTYSAADMIPGSDERPWQQVQYLGVKRGKGWHKWTFKLDPDNGMSLLCDDKPIKAFLKDKIRLNAVSGVVVLGDDAEEGGQTVWIDDVTVAPGAPMRSEPLWPPPPPENLAIVAPPKEQTATPYAQWKNGLSHDPNHFPIAVWLQDPARAPEYKAAGINLYIGLWQGPTEKQLAELKKHGMPVICEQNEVGLKHIDDPIIVGWMHGDEPDNAHQFKEYWKSDKEKIKEAWPELYASQQLDTKPYTGYGPPVPPKWIIRDYEEIRRRDPSRPVMINLGCGVAWEQYVGRGERTGKLEDYPEYIKGCDIVSYDVYPVTTGQLAAQLWYQAQGVGRLCTWTEGRKPVWNCLECTGMSNVNIKPTPQQLRAQAWMALIHGSRGLIYFVHQFNPFNEAALLDDKEMLVAVTVLNLRIQELAPVLNSATIADAVTVTSSEPHTPVHAIVKRHDGATYVFAVSMYSRKTEATFNVAGLPPAAKAEVIGEDRTIDVADGGFKDAFEGHEVHLYRIK